MAAVGGGGPVGDLRADDQQETKAEPSGCGFAVKEADTKATLVRAPGDVQLKLVQPAGQRRRASAASPWTSNGALIRGRISGVSKRSPEESSRKADLTRDETRPG